jgi:NADH-quinone oxidoreductase subunit J
VSELAFYVLAAASMAAALGVVLAQNPVHSALSLVLTLFLIAVGYVTLQAHLVAALQIIVYAGAVMVLFLFVIMLLNLQPDPDEKPHPLHKLGAGLLAGAVAVVVAGAAVRGAGSPVAVLDETFGTTRALAEVLFRDYLVAFELTSLLLLVAVVGAVVLAKRDED